MIHKIRYKLPREEQNALKGIEAVSDHDFDRNFVQIESIRQFNRLEILKLETLPKSLENSQSLETVLLSVFKYGDHSKLDPAIKNLRNKGITVNIHDMHWLD